MIETKPRIEPEARPVAPRRAPSPAAMAFALAIPVGVMAFMIARRVKGNKPAAKPNAVDWNLMSGNRIVLSPRWDFCGARRWRRR